MLTFTFSFKIQLSADIGLFGIGFIVFLWLHKDIINKNYKRFFHVLFHKRLINSVFFLISFLLTLHTWTEEFLYWECQPCIEAFLSLSLPAWMEVTDFERRCMNYLFHLGFNRIEKKREITFLENVAKPLPLPIYFSAAFKTMFALRMTWLGLFFCS